MSLFDWPIKKDKISNLRDSKGLDSKRKFQFPIHLAYKYLSIESTTLGKGYGFKHGATKNTLLHRLGTPN